MTLRAPKISLLGLSGASWKRCCARKGSSSNRNHTQQLELANVDRPNLPFKL